MFTHNYVHMSKITTTTWIILSWTIQIFLLKLVSYKFVENNPKKVLESFFLFLILQSWMDPRIYSNHKKSPKVLARLEIIILSIIQKIVTNKEAHQNQIGGKNLCYVW
jgi:ribosomal protein S8